MGCTQSTKEAKEADKQNQESKAAKVDDTADKFANPIYRALVSVPSFGSIKTDPGTAPEVKSMSMGNSFSKSSNVSIKSTRLPPSIVARKEAHKASQGKEGNAKMQPPAQKQKTK